MTHFTFVKPLQQPGFWLCAIAAALVAFHLNLDWQLTGDIDRLSINLLLWGVLAYLLWRKRHRLNLESEGPCSVFGLALLTAILLRDLLAARDDSLHEVLPFVSMLGLGLTASGGKGLKQYRQEFVVVLLLSLPQTYLSMLIEHLFHMRVLTARFSAFVLWYLGFEVSRQGVDVVLPTGTVEINPSCSSLDSMFILLRLAVLFLVLSSTNKIKKILIPAVAVALAFVINGICIALLAFLLSFSHQQAFEYWHGGSGAQIFSVISILTFAWFCHFLMHQSEPRHT